MITQKLKIRSLAVGCMLLATLGASAQTYDETYHKQDIVLAAQKDGVAYAMTCTISDDGRATKQEISINEDGKIVYLATQADHNQILWRTYKSESKIIHLKSYGTGTFLSAGNGDDLYLILSDKLYNYFSFNDTYHTFTYTKSKLYGILMQEYSFRLLSTEHITNSNKLPIATPYFMAEHTWRSFGSSSFGTICLPKAVRAEEVAGATFYEIYAKLVDNNSAFCGIVLTQVTGDLAAGIPYIYKKKDAATYLVAAMHGDATETAGSSNGLIGTLTGSAEDGGFAVPAGKYILQGDQLWLTTLNGEGESQSRLLAGRAYIDPTQINRSITNKEVAGVKGVVIALDETTAVDAPSLAERNTDSSLFDLAGRRLKGTGHKRIIIKHGKKIYLN